MRANVYFYLLGVAILLTACQPTGSTGTGPAFDLAAASAVIESKTRQFTEAHVNGDQAFLDGIFTADARVYAPNADVIAGRQAISDINAQYLAYGISAFEERSTARYGSRDYIVDEGSYRMTYGPENTTENGHYINIWKQVDGDWKLYANIWTTLPAPEKAE